MSDDPSSPERLEDKIAFVLTIYPVLMPSMLHVGIGPNIRPQLWRPVLERMIADGKVVKEEKGITTHLGQYRTFTFLRLSESMLGEISARISKDAPETAPVPMN
jgi:hypothetical protein